MFGLKRWRRARLRRKPFPAAWERILRQNVPYYARMSESDRAELCEHIKVFIAEKSFEGCAGLEMTDEIRVTIAAQACILLLHREPEYYPGLRSILVYPSRYRIPWTDNGAGGVVTEYTGGRVVSGTHVRLGSAAAQGYVLLSWDDVIRGASVIDDGYNVVFHEFAHHLDSESGNLPREPGEKRKTVYGAWARVLGMEFKSLRRAARMGMPTLLNKYGATNPAEFFAVATESFFEQPAALRRLHPELYEQLKRFYQQDPAAVWESMQNSEQETSNAAGTTP